MSAALGLAVLLSHLEATDGDWVYWMSSETDERHVRVPQDAMTKDVMILDAAVSSRVV